MEDFVIPSENTLLRVPLCLVDGSSIIFPCVLYVVCHDFGDICKDLVSTVILSCSYNF